MNWPCRCARVQCHRRVFSWSGFWSQANLKPLVNYRLISFKHTNSFPHPRASETFSFISMLSTSYIPIFQFGGPVFSRECSFFFITILTRKGSYPDFCTHSRSAVNEAGIENWWKALFISFETVAILSFSLCLKRFITLHYFRTKTVDNLVKMPRNKVLTVI